MQENDLEGRKRLVKRSDRKFVSSQKKKNVTLASFSTSWKNGLKGHCTSSCKRKQKYCLLAYVQISLTETRTEKNGSDSELKAICIWRTNECNSFFHLKSFNFDVPEGWNSYWSDLKRQSQTLFNKQKAGGFLMEGMIF